MAINAAHETSVILDQTNAAEHETRHQLNSTCGVQSTMCTALYSMHRLKLAPCFQFGSA